MTPPVSISKSSKKVEERFEMLQAHYKFRKPIRQILREYNISPATFYYWDKRYKEKGILGLQDSIRGPKLPPRKTSSKLKNEIIELAKQHNELDANDIHEIIKLNYDIIPSIATMQRILKRNGINRPSGKRSKKTMEKKKMIIIQAKKRRKRK